MRRQDRNAACVKAWEQVRRDGDEDGGSRRRNRRLSSLWPAVIWAVLLVVVVVLDRRCGGKAVDCFLGVGVGIEATGPGD
jgi:hypothetical protein